MHPDRIFTCWLNLSKQYGRIIAHYAGMYMTFILYKKNLNFNQFKCIS